MAKKMKQFYALPKIGLEKRAVYQCFLWFGSVSTRFEKQKNCAVKQCFSAMESRAVYSTNELLSATNRDVLHFFAEKQLIYQFSFHCDSHYVDRTSQWLQDKIKQHVATFFRSLSFQKCMYFLPVSANLSPSLISILLLVIQPFVFLFYKILPVLKIMITVDSLFLPKAALLSIYLLLKPLLSKLLTSPSADKNKLCTVSRLCTNEALSMFFSS